MSPRLLKRYPNRRIYDTVASRYITLNDVDRWLMKGIDVVCISEPTQTDITCSVLLQVLLLREQHGRGQLSKVVLRRLLRGKKQPRR